MQNFVSKCIQTINNHRSLAIENRYSSQSGSNTPRDSETETSNVIGALPPRHRFSQRREPRQTSVVKAPENVEGLVNSLPTITPGLSYPPGVAKRPPDPVNNRSNSDQNLTAHKAEVGSVVSENESEFSPMWVEYRQDGSQSRLANFPSRKGYQQPIDKVRTVSFVALQAAPW